MSDDAAMNSRLEALEARLHVLEAQQAITNLKSLYGALADERYGKDGPKPADELAKIADRVVELFTEDAVWDGGAGLGIAKGHAAIRERFLAPTLLFSWHYFVKPRIEVEGDTARGTWDILAPCTTKEGRAMWMSGVEDDEYRFANGRWLHSAMKLRVVFMAPHDRGWAKPRPA